MRNESAKYTDNLVISLGFKSLDNPYSQNWTFWIYWSKRNTSKLYFLGAFCDMCQPRRCEYFVTDFEIEILQGIG